MNNNYIRYLVAASLILGSGCFPKMVVYEGVRIPAGQAVTQINEQAQQRSAANDTESAIRLYASIQNVDPGSDAAAAGLMKAGDMAAGIKSYAQAVSYYQTVRSSYPGTDYAADAGIGIGVIDMRGEKYTEAVDTLKPIVSETGGNRKGRVYFLMGESLYRMGRYPDAFDALARSFELLTADREQALAKLFLEKIAHENLTGSDLRQLLTNNDYNLYENSLLRLKLAQDLFVSDNYSDALNLVNTIIESGVASPGLMNDATSLKNKILAITQVNMNAIGCILPLSGDFAPYGKQVLDGVEQALGIFSTTTSPYTLYVMDSKGIPELAVHEAEQLVKDDHVAAIIGPLLSSTAQEVAYKMQAYNVPLLYLNQKPEIAKVGDYIFQNSLTPRDQTRAIVHYAMQHLGVKAFAVLYPESAYGEDMMREFVQQVLQGGGTVTGLEGYDPAETDFKVQIKQLVGTYYLDLRKADIKKLPPDQKDKPPPIIDFSAIFIPDYYEKVAMIAPQLLYYDVTNVQLLGGNGWSGPGLIQMGGRYVDGGIYTDGFFTQSTDPATKAFTASYEASYHQEPTILSALGFDSANILALALQHASSRAAVKNALLSIRDFHGVSGIISYNGSTVPVKKLYLLQVHGKKTVELSY